MARATGIQITGTAVRVVDIEGSPKKFKVRGFAEVSITDDEMDPDGALVKALREAFKASKAGKEHVILGVPMRDCIVREITIPFTDPEQIRKVIKFESESHLHSCSIDDVVVCFHKVAESGSRSTLVVIAARKEVISRILMALEKIGVDPLAVDIDAAGLYGMVTELNDSAERETYVVCDIGYTSTMITLVKEGQLRIVRSVRMGTDSITARVSKDLDIDQNEARTRTQAIMQQDLQMADDLMVRQSDVANDDEVGKTSSELERDIIRQRQTELIGRLRQEILRSITPAKLEAPPECVYLLGPGSNLPRINADLAEAMSLPVKTLNVLDEVEHRFNSSEVAVMNAALPIATGLALKHLGHDPLNLDFRQEEFVFARKFDRLKVPLFCLLGLFSFLNFFCWYYLDTMAKHEEGKLAVAATRAAGVLDKAIGPGMDKNHQRFLPLDEDERLRLFRGASSDNLGSHERIDYIGRNLKSVHVDLRKAYNLGVTEKKVSRSRRSSSSLPENASDFVSALERWEQVFSALKKVNIKEFSVDTLKASAKEVSFSWNVPRTVEIDGKLLDSVALYAKFRAALQEMPEDVGWEKLEDRGNPKESEIRQDFVLYPQLVISFKRE